MDAKDILGLPKAGPVGDKRVRAPKEPPKKLDRVNREVYALTGGVPPLIAAVDSKQRSTSTKKISWQWLPFTNSARTDNLQISHWTKIVDSVIPTGDYAFAKYNKSVSIVRYTEEEYNHHLVNPKWTRQETDLLFSLCEQFDLRFIIIADRFRPERSVEDLKDRYYSASKAIILSRSTTPGEITDSPHVKDAYNVTYEKERKRGLELLLSRSRHQDREDAEIIAEARRITEARAKLDERTDQAAGNENPPDALVAAAPAVTSAPARQHRVFLRGRNLAQMAQNATLTAGARTVKRIEQILTDELGVRLEPKVPTEAICREHMELRKEVLTFVNLQKQIQWKEYASEVSQYDVPTPNTPKRPFRGVEHAGPRAGVVSGERIAKRDNKRKAPARFSESPPQQKRGRKLKSEA